MSPRARTKSRPTPPSKPAPLLDPDCKVVAVRRWDDELADFIGHDVRSLYVERFWLSVLGPSAIFLLRYLADRLDAAPGGFDLDVTACSQALGLGSRKTTRGGLVFPHTLERCCRFRFVRVDGTTLLVRRSIPHLNERQINRLPEALRLEHERWPRVI